MQRRKFSREFKLGVPTNWRMQNYVSGQYTIFFTGSPCAQGALNLPSSASANDVNRLWSTVTLSKSLGKQLGFFVETSSGNCYIQSFYLKEN